MTTREITITKLEKLSESLLQEVNQYIDTLQTKQLAEAAANASDDYTNDRELTIFTDLDGEDFHDEYD
jgi:hypothetical protein